MANSKHISNPPVADEHKGKDSHTHFFKPANGHYKYINIVLIIAASIPLCYTMFLFIMNHPISKSAMWAMPLSLVFITGLAVLKNRIKFSPFEFIPIALLVISSLGFFRFGFADGFSGIWILAIPPVTYFMAGKRNGFICSAIVLAGILFILLYPNFPRFYYYSNDKLVRIIVIYVIVFLIIHLYEMMRVSKERKLEELNKMIKSERDMFAVMKESLKSGLFLMDKNLIIQDNYSSLLERIFGVQKLGGKKFTSLLSSSCTSTEISTINDFFDMVCERRFDTEMLEDINPLQELKYVNPKGLEKILQCAFVPIENVSGEGGVIMGNIEDVSAKVELQKQVRLGEVKRQEEMNTLFEILQIDPNVFNDFILDTEYEFDTINDILKNQKISSSDALVSIFSSVHAIKSNSVIVGLGSYGKKIHDIETYIKELRGKAEVTFDDMLVLTIRMNEVMKEKDNLKISVKKIKSFSFDEAKKSHADVLVENFERAAAKVSSDIGKKVNLNTSGIDIALLEHIPRRVVKEVLLQLVRNAVFHGIEMPEERLKKGKSDTGNIFISLEAEDGMAHIKIRDDGKGLDIKKIKERAEEMHIIKKDEDIEDINRILQVIFMPGFSTAESEGMHAGRGVGLNLVRSRLKEHGGSVKIQTETDKGSVFHILLPIEEASVEESKEEEGDVTDNE
jgi:two-component system chemotaxis sensor kinase CheA